MCKDYCVYINGVRFMNTEDYSNRREMSFGEAIEMCEKCGCTLKASGYRKGYIRRNKSKSVINAVVVPYDGRYGVGYVIHTEESASTNYHHVYYYTL